MQKKCWMLKCGFHCGLFWCWGNTQFFAGGQPTHPRTLGLWKTTALLAGSSRNQLTTYTQLRQQTDCLILHSTWCTLLCNAYPSISLCCAFASAALKPSCKPLGWFCSTSSAASSLNQQSTHSGAKRVFKSRFGSSGLFCCQKNNTQDWLSLSFFAVWAWAAVKVRVCGWAALLTSTTVCPLPVCLYGRWWNPTHFTYQTSAHELRVH